MAARTFVASIASHPASAQTGTTIATGLNGPRGLKFGPDGALNVGEAGRRTEHSVRSGACRWPLLNY